MRATSAPLAVLVRLLFFYLSALAPFHTSFSFTLPNQTVLRLEPYVVTEDVVFYIFIDEEFFTNVSDTKQISDLKLHGLVEGALRDFAAKAAINRELSEIAQQIEDRARAQKQADLLKKLG